MAHQATEREIVGRTIVAVDFNPFEDGYGGVACSPVLRLDNGKELFPTPHPIKGSAPVRELPGGGAIGGVVGIDLWLGIGSGQACKIELTDEERQIITTAKIASSNEVDELIEIIERLCGERLR